MWEFETDGEFQAKLDWAADFLRTKVEPLQYVINHPLDLNDPVRQELIPPLQEEVRKAGLWGCHLGPELGGQGFGQVKLALLNEILGRTGPGPTVGPVVFGCAAPDTGNAEILAHFGTQEQKDLYLKPLLDGTMFSAFSMTEPQGGSDPKTFKTSAVLDGDEWVINGEKWFSSNGRWAELLIVLAVTDPDASPYDQMSMFVVPMDTPGVEIVRNVGVSGWVEAADGGGDHSYIRYRDVRIPKDNILHGPGQGFFVAQTRLSGGRVHHAMRSVGHMKAAFEMLTERAASRFTQGEQLSQKQQVQVMIADAWMKIEMCRLFVMQTAWKIDTLQDYKAVRKDISASKIIASKTLIDVATTALQIHGSLGISDEMPFVSMIVNGLHVGLADGPTEVHKVTVARELMRGIKPHDGLFPSQHIPTLVEQARELYGDTLVRHGR